MNANPKFLAATAHVDEAAVKPLPRSRKVYVDGSRSDIRVPMREISQTDTPAAFGAEANPPVYVYDTSGPYTDPQAKIDIRSGLAALRARWIEERGDTHLLDGPTSRYGKERLADPKWSAFEMTLPSIMEEPWGLAVALPEREGAWGKFMAATLEEMHRNGKMIELEKKWNIPASAYLKKMNAEAKAKTKTN